MNLDKYLLRFLPIVKINIRVKICTVYTIFLNSNIDESKRHQVVERTSIKTIINKLNSFYYSYLYYLSY